MKIKEKHVREFFPTSKQNSGGAVIFFWRKETNLLDSCYMVGCNKKFPLCTRRANWNDLSFVRVQRDAAVCLIILYSSSASPLRHWNIPWHPSHPLHGYSWSDGSENATRRICCQIILPTGPWKISPGAIIVPLCEKSSYLLIVLASTENTLARFRGGKMRGKS